MKANNNSFIEEIKNPYKIIFQSVDLNENFILKYTTAK